MPRTPDYVRVVEGISEQIRSGQREPGSKLPKYADLAAEYEVSVTTLQTALRMLTMMGLIEGQQGKGVFVANPLPPE